MPPLPLLPQHARARHAILAPRTVLWLLLVLPTCLVHWLPLLLPPRLLLLPQALLLLALPRGRRLAGSGLCLCPGAAARGTRRALTPALAPRIPGRTLLLLLLLWQR